MALLQQINRPQGRPMLLYMGRALAAGLGALGLGLVVLGLPGFGWSALVAAAVLATATFGGPGGPTRNN